MDSLLPYISGSIALGVIVLGVAALLAKFYRQVDQGKVLIINTLKSEPTVTFTGKVVLPVIHRAEVMDISLKTVEIDRRGKEGLICKDNIRADIKVTFFVRVNKTRDDVLKVAQSIGCARASDQETLENLFEAKFSEALKTVGKSFDFEELYTKRDEIKDQVVRIIGRDLNGYMLEDAAIDTLEQTPVELLDKDNILDSQGIRKITQLTTEQNVHTNELRQAERMAITKRNVEADEAIFALERQRAEAAARQKREIDSVQAREVAEAQKVQAEERAKSELARIRADEEILINEQNKQRQVEVAQKNRERVIGVETERVEKDRALEAIVREREVELQRIAKEKALEGEKKAIADVVRARIVVEKTVAAEEEAIKDLRLLAEAKRQKDAVVIHAEAEAQEKLVKDIKAAEASNEVARFLARERLTLAEADLEAADKQATAKTRLAEGTLAEAAAPGLAGARVREADALAAEKQGLAQARVVRERLLAEAAGEQEKGLVQVRVQEAAAQAVHKRGVAEAAVVQERLQAEARGLADKAEAMKALDGVGRQHEEFRLQLQKDRDVALESLRTRKDIAQSQAQVLAEALGKAKFNIVGGDGAFFERFVKAVSLGQSIDGALEHGTALHKVLEPYLTGERELGADLKEVLARPGVASDVQNLAVAALLNRTASVGAGPRGGEER